MYNKNSKEATMPSSTFSSTFTDKFEQIWIESWTADIISKQKVLGYADHEIQASVPIHCFLEKRLLLIIKMQTLKTIRYCGYHHLQKKENLIEFDLSSCKVFFLSVQAFIPPFKIVIIIMISLSKYSWGDTGVQLRFLFSIRHIKFQNIKGDGSSEKHILWFNKELT